MNVVSFVHCTHPSAAIVGERESVTPHVRGSALPLLEVHVADVTNEDIDEQEESIDGVMSVYLRAVYARIQSELSSSQTNQRSLLKLLKENEWWIRAAKAKQVCGLLGVEFDEPSYYNINGRIQTPL
jgi:hypothetical protein